MSVYGIWISHLRNDNGFSLLRFFDDFCWSLCGFCKNWRCCCCCCCRWWFCCFSLFACNCNRWCCSCICSWIWSRSCSSFNGMPSTLLCISCAIRFVDWSKLGRCGSTSLLWFSLSSSSSSSPSLNCLSSQIGSSNRDKSRYSSSLSSCSESLSKPFSPSSPSYSSWKNE